MFDLWVIRLWHYPMPFLDNPSENIWDCIQNYLFAKETKKHLLLDNQMMRSVEKKDIVG